MLIRPLSDLLQTGQLPVPLVVERSTPIAVVVVEEVAVAVLDRQLGPFGGAVDLLVTALLRQLAHLQLLFEEDRFVATPHQVSLKGLAQFQQLPGRKLIQSTEVHAMMLWDRMRN